MPADLAQFTVAETVLPHPWGTAAFAVSAIADREFGGSKPIFQVLTQLPQRGRKA